MIKLWSIAIVVLMHILGRKTGGPMSNGLIVKMDDLSEVACRQVNITWQGKRYRITGEYGGLQVHGIENCLTIRPVVANQIFIDQSPLFVESSPQATLKMYTPGVHTTPEVPDEQ
jgi:hypothetical protein